MTSLPASLPARFRWLVVVLGVALLASCAPGTDGIVITSAAYEEPKEKRIVDGPPIRFALPTIPTVRLPAISAAGEFDALLDERLGALELTPIDGVEVVTLECDQDGIVYQGDETSDIFANANLGYNESFEFEINEDGSGTYVRNNYAVRTEIRVFGDGAGQFVESGSSRYTSIQVAADGAGEYFKEEPLIVTTVRANADGSGDFYRKNRESLLTIKLHPEGGGELYSEALGEKVTVDAHANGTGSMFYQVADRTVTVMVRPDGSWQAQDIDFDHTVSLTVNADGSGQYTERGIGPALVLDFDANGKTEGPDVIVPDRPEFIAAASFPRLGSLASLEPPCATVVRFDSEVFFEFNKAELRPEAEALLAELAPALIEVGRSLEINGHTDAIGTEEYNQDLSERRAQSVATLLRNLGVSGEMLVRGFGETQPVAPNFNPDGSDNELGQSQNRRVELVIGG